MELRSEIMEIWERIGIRRGDGIKSAIIATRAPAAIFLGNHMKMRGPWAFGTAYNACFF
jgi:hypothetical protein